MFGEEFDKARAEETAKQRAEQAQRARALTEESNLAHQSSASTRGDLNSYGIGERPAGEVQEIIDRVEQYENLLKTAGGSAVTEPERERFISQVAAEIDARQTSTSQATLKAAATHVTPPTLAAEAPAEVSAFEKEKQASLQRLGAQLAAARAELAQHETTRNALQQQFEGHSKAVTDAQRLVDNFKANNPLVFGLGLRKKSQQLQNLRVARDAATAKKNAFASQTGRAFTEVKSAIERLTSSIKKIEQDHKQLAASEDPSIVEQRRKKELALAEQQRKEAQLAAERAATLAEQQRRDAETARALALEQQRQKAAATHITSPALASEVPVKAPAESSFEQEKQASLQRLGEELATAKAELAQHQATRDRLQQELNTHVKNVKTAETAIAQFEREHPVRVAASLFKPSERLNQLCYAQNEAVKNKRQFEQRNLSILEAAKTKIGTLNTQISRLGQEHKRVTETVDPLVLEQQRLAQAVAREQQHQQDIEEAKIAGRLLREQIEAQLAAERAATLAKQQEEAGATAITRRPSLGSTSSEESHSAPSTPPGKERSGSEGSTSGEESAHSTPEKQPSFAGLAMTQAERLEAKIESIHAKVVRAREAVKEAEHNIEENIFKVHSSGLNIQTIHSFWNAWTSRFEGYFNLAEERSKLKQQLAMLKGMSLEPIFKASDKKALLSQYKDAKSEKRGLFEALQHTSFPRDLQNIYKANGICTTLENYRKQPAAIQELDRSLSQQLQQRRQRATVDLLKSELALLAPEEHGPVLQQIEECIWPNMPGFSEDDREKAIACVYCDAAQRAAEIERIMKYPSLSYTREQAAKDHWEREGKWDNIRAMADRQHEQQMRINQMRGGY